MANAYVPPGVSVSEYFSPSVSPLVGSPADICVVGLAGNAIDTQTPLTTTDVVILTGTEPIALPTIAALNSDAQMLSLVANRAVLDVLDPGYGTPIGAGYVEGVDFSVDLGMGAPDGDHATISRLDMGNIPDGRLVAVTYTYVPADYWNPIRLFDIGAVESRFGASWLKVTSNVTNQTYYAGVNSQLSMAARIAFENGAASVVCQPLFVRTTPGDNDAPQQAPAANEIGESSTWQDTLYPLRAIEDIDVIVPVIGADTDNVSDSSVLAAFGEVQKHIAYMNTQQQYIVGVYGEDGTIEGIGNNSSGLMYLMRNTHAPGLQASFGGQLAHQSVLLNNTVYTRPTPGGANANVLLGGQYAAAAVAGALASRPVSSSLTRKPILGFSTVTDPRTAADKNDDAGAGMFVIENIKGQVRCRHAITLDRQNGPEFSELSVVRSKHLMMESIRDTLDNQIIGNIIADANSPLVVRSAVSGVLQILTQSNVIVGFTTPLVALTSLNPTTITVTFSYKAAFPVNYVDVTFSLDMTSGALSFAPTSA